MAVRAIPRTRALDSRQKAALPALVLTVTLFAPILDVLGLVQPAALISRAAVIAAALATVALVACWARFPRTNWLAAASLAASAGFALRLLGADVAPLLSLLSIVALGIGGAFATHDERDLSPLDA